MDDVKTVKVMLLFPKGTTEEPVAYGLIKNYDLKINILKAHVNYNSEGKLLIEISGKPENVKKGLAYIKQQGVKAVLDGKATSIDFDKCVGCGACIAACEVGALSLDENSKLVFDGTKCLECMLCIKACPRRIITNIFD